MDGRSRARAVVIDQHRHTLFTIYARRRPRSNPGVGSADPPAAGRHERPARRRRGRRAGAHQPPGIFSKEKKLKKKGGGGERADADVWADSPFWTPHVIRAE